MARNLVRLTSVVVILTLAAPAAVAQTATCSYEGLDGTKVLLEETAKPSQPAGAASIEGSHARLTGAAPTVCAFDLSEFDEDTQDTRDFAIEEISGQTAKRNPSFMSKRF